MAVNKNFVVKNGLEVNDNLLVADETTQKVGIGTSVSYYTLHVQGGIGATEARVTGVSTFVGDVHAESQLNVTGVTSVSASTAYVNALKIDGVTTPVWWVGGSAPSDGGGSGLDTYSFNIIKTGNGTFHVIGNQVKTS